MTRSITLIEAEATHGWCHCAEQRYARAKTPCEKPRSCYCPFRADELFEKVKELRSTFASMHKVDQDRWVFRLVFALFHAVRYYR